MRVGVVLNTFPELSETFLIHHVAALIDGGHDVTIFTCPAEPGPSHEAVWDYGLLPRARFLRRQTWGPRQAWDVPRTLVSLAGTPGVLRCLNAARYGTGVFRFRALHALRDFAGADFDVLHCQYAAVGWAFLPYRDVFGVPLVTSFHGDHYRRFGRDGGGHLGPLFRLGDAFIANGRFLAGELEHLGCPVDKIHVIPAVVEDRGVVWRARSGGCPGPNGHLRILCVARLDAVKGIHVAIEAVGQLRAAGHCAELTIAGEGPDRTELEKLRDRLELQAAVSILGWRTQRQVFDHLRDADVLVLPSVDAPYGWSETQGVVLQEAMLHGVPVVASDSGGIPESLDDGRVGTLIPPGDPAALATAILDLSAHPKRTKARVHAGEAYVRARYLKPSVLHAHERVYRDAIANYARTRDRRPSYPTPRFA